MSNSTPDPDSRDSIRRQIIEGVSSPFAFDEIEADDPPPTPGTLRARQHSPEFDARPDTEIDREALAFALAEIIDWLVPKHGIAKPSGLPNVCGLRVIALAWVVNPARFGGMSQCKLADALGVSDSILSRYAGQFTQRFGIRSRAQLTVQEIAQRKAARTMPPPPSDPSAN